MKICLCLCSISFLILSIGILSASGEVTKRIVCYYLSWTKGHKHPYSYAANDIPTDLCTDIVYAFLTMNEETWELRDPDTDFQRQLTTFSSWSSSSGPHFLVGVGGALDVGPKWSAMASDPSKRSSFVSSALTLIRDYGLHGMDLYWGNPEAKDRENYVKLVEELRAAFRPAGYILTSTMSLGEIVLSINETISGYDVQRLSELLDWINVQSYYMRGPWNDFVDVHSPLYRREYEVPLGKMKYMNVHDGLEIMVKLGAPRFKLVMAVPFFGTSYTLQSPTSHHPGAPANKSTGGGDPGNVTNQRGFLAYFEICREVISGKWQRRFDHEAKCPYAFQGNQWVGYEDEQSVNIKMDYIKNRGYGGAFVWSVNYDDFNGFCGSKNSLLRTVHSALSKKKVKIVVDSPELVLRKRYEAMGIVPTCT